MLAITSKCCLSLFLLTASRTCSWELTIFNSMVKKSHKVFLGQPHRWNAFAMLHWFWHNACATFSYRPWIFATLWLLTWLMFVSCCSCAWFSSCWPSLWALWSAFTSTFGSAIIVLAWTHLLSIFLMTLHLSRTRSANSSASFSFRPAPAQHL